MQIDNPRRKFLQLTATAASLVGASRIGFSATAQEDGRSLPDPKRAPFDTVVVLMLENRSFDHLLGWLPGANGRQTGLSYADKAGRVHPTFPLAPDFQGCGFLDPEHTWEAIKIQYADGRCDGWLKTPSAKAGDLFAIGYYREDELPILSALAKGYTTFDNYFCSMMGPTWENRLYQLSATTQLMENCDFPREGEDRPVEIETTIFDRVRHAGLSSAYYFHASPITKLFKSRKYDDITYPIEHFWSDAREGNLANVVFIDPDYSDLAEDMGTSNDYHPWSNLLAAEGFLAQVHNALKASPQWDRMVFVLNFDEHGGFFDHVPPPRCQDDTVVYGPDLKRLGFRVPAIAMGPFAPRKIEKSGPYEHCSILKMIEWRWGLEPLRLRDQHAKNLAGALDFTTRREAIHLPEFTPMAAAACWEGGGWIELPVSPGGDVTIEIDKGGAHNVTYSARLFDSDADIAVAMQDTPIAATRVQAQMTLSKEGVQAIRKSDNRLPAFLETAVRSTTDGSVCRSTSPVLLRILEK